MYKRQHLDLLTLTHKGSKLRVNVGMLGEHACTKNAMFQFIGELQPMEVWGRVGSFSLQLARRIQLVRACVYDMGMWKKGHCFSASSGVG